MARCPDCGQEADLIDEKGARFLCGCVRLSRPRRLWHWVKARWINFRSIHILPPVEPENWDDLTYVKPGKKWW